VSAPMSNMPPPPPPMGPPPGYQPYGQGFGPQQRLSKATTAMVMGIIGVVCFPIIFSILAIVFGVQAKNQIDQSPGMYNNRGQAVAGQVLGIIGLSFGVIFIAIRLGAS